YAPFGAVLQSILEAGSIKVVFHFVSVLVSIEKSQREDQFNKQWIGALVGAVALGALFVRVFVRSKALHDLTGMPMAQLPEQSNTQEIAAYLPGTYMLAFAIPCLLLSVVIIGALVCAYKRT